MPVDLLVDPSGSTLWVASIAEGVGLVRVDVASGRVEPFAAVRQPHGLARTADGAFVVHDGHVVSRVDGETGAVTRLASVDAFKLVVAANGAVYGATGGPTGAASSASRRRSRRARRRYRPARPAPRRKGSPAPMLPSALAIARDGSLLVAQIEPVPAIRRVNLSAGTIVTLARGR